MDFQDGELDMEAKGNVEIVTKGNIAEVKRPNIPEIWNGSSTLSEWVRRRKLSSLN